MVEPARKAPQPPARAEHRSLGKIPLFSALSPDEIRVLDTRCFWKRVGGGEWVIDYQAEGADVYFVFSGLARVVMVSAGREMILRDIREGEYFGHYSAIDAKPRSAAIVAITDTVVARMPCAVLWEAIHAHEKVREGVLRDLVSDIRTANQRAHEQANFDVRKRLCAELIRLSRTTSEGRVVVSPPPTHAEFAARISTHREAVTKTLSALEREGLISRSPAAIVLLNPAQLRRELAAES
jgi:CRP/FNR family transcriptional regulator, cyclic AMP receptor protein